MSNIWLTFQNALFEKKYKAFKKDSYKASILIVLLILIGMAIYQLSIENYRSPQDYATMYTYLAIALFSFIFHKKLPQLQFWVILISGLLIYFVRINIRMENLTRVSLETLTMKGYNWGILYTIIQLNLPHFKYVVAFEIGCSAIRYSLVTGGFTAEILTVQIIESIYIMFMRYMMEKKDRNQFKELNTSIENLAKFKELIKSHLPSGILVMENLVKTTLFLNDQFKMYLNNDESDESVIHFLKSIRNEKDQLVDDSTRSHSKSSTLLEIIENFISEKENDSETIKVYGTYRDDSGNKRTVEVTVLQLPWDGKDAIAIILNDITVQEAILSLKAANTNKEEVISTVSHELRTPLAGILGILQIMEALCLNNQEMKKYVDILQTNAHILLSFLNSILDFQQLRANKLKLNISKINLSKLLNDIKPMFDFQCSFKDIEYKLNVSPGVPKHIFCDKERLTQILINLSGNALKFTFQGSITLGVREDPNDDNSIIFSVSDTGVGIKVEDLEQLFKAFGKLDDKAGINKKGVGLGLLISNTLVKLLNKNNDGIQVESELTQGTTFTFRIPIYPKQKEDSENSTNNSVADEVFLDQLAQPVTAFLTPKARSGSPDILVRLKASSESIALKDFPLMICPLIKTENLVLVDDNAFNLMIAEKLIEKHKIQVRKAYNGQEAIGLVKSLHSQGEAIRMIFMDCHMPIMDGYEATGILRSMMKGGEIPYIPIIALSANNYEQDIKQSLDAGMDDHMCKPLNEHGLASILDKYSRSSKN